MGEKRTRREAEPEKEKVEEVEKVGKGDGRGGRPRMSAGEEKRERGGG